jgi:subtilisin family serine protease
MADDTRVTHSRPGFACALALLCALGLSLPAEALASDIIVRRDSGLTAAERADVRADAGVRLDRMLKLPNTELVTVPAAREDRALAVLNADPDVRLATLDVPVRAAAEPDERYPLQWALNNIGPWSADATAVKHSDIDADEAWAVSTGAGVVVGLVDMSVYAEHPDFREEVPAEEGPPTVESHVEEGADFVAVPGGCPTPEGPADHGTHVAGTIVAARGNGGIVGVAPDAHVMPLRALDNCGAGTLSSVMEAFQAAGAAGLPIVVASFGTDPWLDATHRASVNAQLAGVFKDWEDQTLFVVAAGNEGNDNDELPVYPCATTEDGVKPPNLLCVGMTDSSDSPVCWGNVGRQTVDLFAPGVRIHSTVRGVLGWTNLSGTSMAAPIVAGAAALLKAAQADLDPGALAAKLRDHVDGKEPLEDLSVAGGRLNAAVAVDFPGRLDPAGGDGWQWATCDRDHDGFLDNSPTGDLCPDTPGTLKGCPDGDGDGVRDLDDNCQTLANANQMDVDADRVGDACDPTPRGEDVDGDAKAALDDRCPTQAAPTPDGCPIIAIPPAPPPVPSPLPAPQPPAPPAPSATRIVSVKVAVRCVRRNPCRKAAKVTVRVSRDARVALKVEQRVRTRGRLRWKRITSRSLAATAGGRSLTVRGKRGRSLAKGSYRVTVTLSGGTASKRSFRV